ncbi:hypothetical protein ANCDUO_06962 [Ancylostoma duodenale]|uniref:Nematode cuticle collagen N-terminal domain-containing protein n=1 Tax=Ancylostoma duodenale TaxID=51022 RepID=A0A0C2GN99_9BILA|nr:hypothetical protein ANCDUO_06962 [Ancylostoma duodenale]
MASLVTDKRPPHPERPSHTFGMDLARSSSYIAIGLSNIVIITTLAYIPYMLTQIDSVLDSIKVHNDEFQVVETAVKMEFRGIREDGPRKRRQAEGVCSELCTSSTVILSARP